MVQSNSSSAVRRRAVTLTALGLIGFPLWLAACGSDAGAPTSGAGDGAVGHAGTSGAAGAGSVNGGSGTTGAGATGGAVGVAGMAGVGSGSAGAAGGGSAGAAGGGSAGAAGGGSAGAAGTGSIPTPGNADGKCSSALPARGQAVNVSTPTTVVGTGAAASCTFDSLKAAVEKGGVITFNCGSAPATIVVTSTLNLPTNKNTVIDGGGNVTLDGGKTVQILRFDSPDFRANDNGLTLQHLTLINGKTTPKAMIPAAPAPCSQGYNDGEGGALYMRDGNLTVIDCTFTGNQAAPLGPDTGGGAIYLLGSKQGAVIVGSTFKGNVASNAGAVGGLVSELAIYNSLFTDNQATGSGANGDEPNKCSVLNNGQHETGSGGNGAAIYSDGFSVNVTLCGNKVVNNKAGEGAFGGGLFFTSNDLQGTLSIADTTITGNTGGAWTNDASGKVKSVGSAIGVNAKSIVVTNSTLQGAP